MNWQPEWEKMQRIGEFGSVEEALDRYYKPERLNNAGRASKIVFRENTLSREGWICLASWPDSVTGEALFARFEDGKIAIYQN